MCQKFKCPHGNDVMCSCEAIKTGGFEDVKHHMIENLEGFDLELFYESLETPAPYRLCASGACKACGGRLCISAELPDYLYGDGLLAAVYHHMKRLHMDTLDRFPALFHEEDRPAVRRWLEGLENPDGERVSQKQETAAKVYTIVQTAVDADRSFFPDPFPWGSYLSLDQARERLTELIAAEKKDLSDRYNKEDISSDHWEAYEDGYAASRFVRIEILTSDLVPALEGGAHDA